ncbi:MAG: ATP-dependent helicase [Leptolyngbyaceae cyanobacterium]
MTDDRSADLLDQLRHRLRPGQREIADWQGGSLVVSAVPEAGKSTGMAVAAAISIARHQLHQRQQLVVVTFTRSAAANIRAKIRDNLNQLALPLGGFAVHTLHGLAWAIARTHPERSGLNPDSVLVTPTSRHRLIRSTVEQWINGNPRQFQRLVEGQQFDGEEAERLRRQSVLRTEVLPDLAATVIHEAKSSGLLPDHLEQLSHQVADDYAILEIAAGLYNFYQMQLRFRRVMDYDDMILAAITVLKDPAIRQHWQQQIFAVFEDEAQDSTPLQTQLLEILAADSEHGSHLVRVGDSNQAINSTFTPADPIFFRQFCRDCQAQGRLATMNQAGRSAQPIWEAANFLLKWVNQSKLAGSEQPFQPQLIHPTEQQDPQPNPPPEGAGLELYTPEDTYQTVEWLGKRALTLFKHHPEAQAAVLVRTNEQGRFVANELNRWYGDRLQLYEVGQRDRQSHVPAEMLTLIQFCDRPHSPDYLKAALTTLMQRKQIPSQDINALVSFPEQFLYPGPLDATHPEPVQQARQVCTQLLRSRLALPTYQLISFLAQSLDYDQSELATADKLASRILQQTNGEYALSAWLQVLSEIVAAERFDPVDPEGSDARYTRPGQLTIITMHKAKGLDWDYVFIPFLHENMIPGTLRVPPQAQFLGDFTLAEVARAQIRASLHQAFLHKGVTEAGATAQLEPEPLTDVNTAWQRAKHLKTAEEYRLLYVAMTRARRLLWMSAARKAPFTWNKPENLDNRKPSPAFLALKAQFMG